MLSPANGQSSKGLCDYTHTHCTPRLLLSFNSVAINPHLIWSKSLILSSQIPPSTVPPVLAHSEPPAQEVLCRHTNTGEFHSWRGVHMILHHIFNFLGKNYWPILRIVQRQLLAFNNSFRKSLFNGEFATLPLTCFHQEKLFCRQGKLLQSYPTHSLQTDQIIALGHMWLSAALVDLQ